MKILLFNWQCIRNPLGGGAEVHMHEIFKRIVAMGNQVTLYCCTHPELPNDENIDGIQIHRRGKREWFNFLVPKIYRDVINDGYDIVVDDINKIPFYTPLFVKKHPILAISHHFFGKSILRQAGLIGGSYVLAAEKLVDWVYKSTHFAVVSQSTLDEFISRGFDPNKLSKNKKNVSSRDTSFITPTQQNETNVEQLNPNDRLPTLREQMKIIADKQAEIEVDVEVIKSEISLIKAELVELKSNLMNNGKIEPKQIFTGEPTPKIQKIPQKQIEEETFILPDEAVKDTPQKKHNNNLKPFNIKPSKNNDNKPQSINKRNEENIITKNSKEQNITDQTEKTHSKQNQISTKI